MILRLNILFYPWNVNTTLFHWVLARKPPFDHNHGGHDDSKSRNEARTIETVYATLLNMTVPCQAKHPSEIVVPYVVGATAGSVHVSTMLGELCRELQRRLPGGALADREVPDTDAKLLEQEWVLISSLSRTLFQTYGNHFYHIILLMALIPDETDLPCR